MKKNIIGLFRQMLSRKTTFSVTCFLALVLYTIACSKKNDPDNVDTIPPAEVSNLNGIPGDGQVTLTWTDPTDNDFSKVEITYSPNGSTVEVAKGAQTGTVTGLTNGTAYTFTVKTIDTSGNKSGGVTSPSYTPRGVDPDDHTPPAEVSNLRTVSGNAQITLTWNDPPDGDFAKARITYTPAGENMPVEIGKGTQTATVTDLTNGTGYIFTIKTVDASGNESAGINSESCTPEAPATPTVYMTTDISSAGLMAIYQALGRMPKEGQKVGVKISTGEGQNSNHLRPVFIEALVKAVNGDIIECNTAYGGSRASTAVHYQTARDHGYMDIATVVIMDENSVVNIPVRNGTRLSSNRVGAHFPEYKFHVVLSHFKGHAMAGYGGALKNMSIGYASTAGKCLIHTGGASSTSPWGGNQTVFLESMAEAAKSIVDYAGKENYIYINVMNRLSVDCDCNANPAQPTMADIGILASLDPVALDKACLDLVDAAPDGSDLRNRITRQDGKRVVNHAAEIGLGSLTYNLVSID
jgi:uncharacterized Fe-S center protein